MADTLSIGGTFSQETTALMREALAGSGVSVVGVSGLGSERILRLVGDFTRQNIDQIRAAVLKLLDVDVVKTIEVKVDSVKLENVPAHRMKATKDTVLEILHELRAAAKD